MAGSKREMLYQSDIIDSTGDAYKWIVIDCDESNAKLTGGIEATPGNKSGKELAGKGVDYSRIQLRKLHLQGKTTGGKTVKKSIIACNPENTLVANGGTTIMGVMVGPNTMESVTFTITGVSGERRTFLRTQDTGLDDGTDV